MQCLEWTADRQEAAAKECYPDAELQEQLECFECPPCAAGSLAFELTLSKWEDRTREDIEVGRYA